ncbi:MAG: LPS-assembly protein [Parvibaculaceae bacterium]|jgi:LPS-assembly protein
MAGGMVFSGNGLGGNGELMSNRETQWSKRTQFLGSVAQIGFSLMAFPFTSRLLLGSAAVVGLTLSDASGQSAFAAPTAPLPTVQSVSEDDEVLMQADELVYNQDTQIVTAEGNVEIVYGPRILMADRVTYNQITGKVSAQGNVSLVEPSGDVVFADNVELTDEMKNGIVESISILLADKSRLAGSKAERKDGNVTTLHKGVFSPCEVCKDDPTRAPSWQVKAYKVVHNNEEHRILYEDAIFEVLGVPVMYLPFFSHPDPTVERQSGFLTPSFKVSDELGTQFQLPYYWAIQPNMDATLTPRYTRVQGMLYQGQFRHRLNEGQYSFDVATNFPKNPQEDAGTPADTNFRGSFFSEAAFKTESDWTWGWDVELTSDDTFLRRFDISSDTDLTSTAYVEKAFGEDYLRAEGFFFQGLLSTDDDDTTPFVAPLINYHHVFDDQILGGDTTLDTNVMVLRRTEGANSTRFSNTFGWERPTTTESGELYTFFASLRGDIYHTNDVTLDDGSLSDDNYVARALPSMGVEWRWPLVQATGGSRQIIEPIVQLIYSPYGGNPDEIPDEDSSAFDFDDSNLFDRNRFAGLDQWEGGPRANIGVQASTYSAGGGFASFMIGQTLRMRENSAFSQETGLRDQQSDYVGATVWRPNSNFEISHRFRVDHNSWEIHRNEVYLSGNYGPLSGSLTYGQFGDTFSSGLQDREEIHASAKYQFAEYWSVSGSTRQDLEDSLSIENKIGIDYLDECIGFGLSYEESNYEDRDIQPEQSIIFRISLKHLGGAAFSQDVTENTTY